MSDNRTKHPVIDIIDTTRRDTHLILTSQFWQNIGNTIMTTTSDRKLVEFYDWTLEYRGMNQKLSAAIIDQIGLDDFDYLVSCAGKPCASSEITINGFDYYNQTLKFYEDNLDLIKDWIKSEAESLSNVFDSSADMILSLPALFRENATLDEVSALLYRSCADNRADDMGLYEVFANAVSKVVASRVIDYYGDFQHDYV